MEKRTKKKVHIALLLLLIAVFSISIRLLGHYKIHASALLYIAIPFVIALALTIFTNKTHNGHWASKYWNITRDALIVMLASSVVLFEGFVCVAMFLPIYFFMIMLALLSEYIWRISREKSHGKLSMLILPALILVSSLEGTHPKLSLNRLNQVSASTVVDAGIAEIKENLTKPIQLGTSRPWFLKIFPMPYRINAESLNPRDVHEIHYRYQRWFFMNTHEGRALLKIAEVGDNHIKTEFIEDNSYISNYMTLRGTHIRLQPITESKTRVTLTIAFERKLDPAWYFGPLERYGIRKTADYLITEVIAPDD